MKMKGRLQHPDSSQSHSEIMSTVGTVIDHSQKFYYMVQVIILLSTGTTTRVIHLH